MTRSDTFTVAQMATQMGESVSLNAEQLDATLTALKVSGLSDAVLRLAQEVAALQRDS